jgi:hypothetical protein
MKPIIILTLFILCSFSSIAQNTYSVKGSVADTTEKVKLVNTTVAVLNAKDSILRKFVWTGASGSFAIDKLAKGKYILLITYPGYADYVDNFSLDSVNTSHDFGSIDMILKSRLLAGVIIKGEVTAIKIKGDTTEFNARAYKIQPNDKVEDLLRQLPGIEVDKDGKITAQGQTVTKVLVDGEEFFGDDPTLVTKNLRADMVDKVQLYDKKSDQAAFTGIDDGVKTKTLNIKLKEDKKNGYFGKVDGGIGTDGYYEGQALFNKFTAKNKLSLYGTMSNTSKIGLGWEDSNKAGTSSDNMQFGDGGGIYFSNDGNGDDLDSFNGQYNGQGIPIARTGGAHYDGKWDSDKQSINANYKIGSLQVDGTNSTLTQNNLPTGIIDGNSDQSYHKYIFRQKLDVTYNTKLDTTQTLKIGVAGTDKNNNVTEDYLSINKRGDGTLLNQNDRNVTNKVDQQVFDANVFYTKKFKKVGRTLSVNVSESYNNSNAKGFLKSTADFYDDQGKFDSLQRINQYKTVINTSSVLNTNITYTEPLSKRFSVVANYGFGINNGRSDRETHDSTAFGRYDKLDTALSNDFKLNQFTNQVGAIFNYKKNKTIINFGTRVSTVSFQQINAISGDEFKRHFTNWDPQASYQYKFSQQEGLNISYNGNTTQPSITQIQPVRNNTDPLNISIGNPDLKPSFTHRFNLNYNSYKVLTGQYIGIYGNYSITTDPIVSNTNTDSTGKTVYRSVNINKQLVNYYVGAYFGRKIKVWDLTVGLNLNSNGNSSYNYTNNVLNMTKSYTYSGQFTIQKYVQKKYYMNLQAGPTYTINESSLQQQVNNNGRGFTGSYWAGIYLPFKFMIGSDASYQYTAATESFNQDFSKLLINASITKSFYKDENLKIVLSGNDLLNQNVGFSRNAYGNMIIQNSYTTIKRYFMVSVVWDFNKFGTVKSEK